MRRIIPVEMVKEIQEKAAKEIQEGVVKVVANERQVVGKLDTNELMRMHVMALIMENVGAMEVEAIASEKVT